MRTQSKREKVPGVPGFYRTKRDEGFVYEFRAPGETKWTRVPNFPDENEARRWRNKFLGAEEVERIRPSKAAFAEIAEVVMDSYRRRASTKQLHEANFASWLKPLDRIRVQEIDKHTLIQRVIRPMEEKGLSGSTIHNVLMSASLVFEAAIDARLIVVNPVKRLKAGVDKPTREGKSERTTLSAEQFAALLAHAGAQKVLYAVMGLAGLRLSEALGLTWDNVLFDSMQLRITQQLSRDGRDLAPLKTADSKALIDMAPSLAQMLAQLALDVAAAPGDFVFWNANAKPYSRRSIQRSLTAACGRAGVPVVTPHELRHSCGSAILAATGDPAVAARQLRHSNVNTFLTVYAHEWGELKKPGAVGAVIDGSLGAAIVAAPQEAGE